MHPTLAQHVPVIIVVMIPVAISIMELVELVLQQVIRIALVATPLVVHQ
jgi:hypothetical protein